MKYTKICAHCGQPFETNSTQKIYCNREHYRPCPVCGKPVKMIDNDFSRPPKCCSTECSHKLRQSKFKKRTCIFCGKLFTPHSGSQIACDDTHYDNCEICGKQFIRTVSNYNDKITTCSTECTQEKLRRRSLAKYGTEHPMQSDEVQKNFHDAMFKKYGVKHALQIPGKIEQQQKHVIETNTERWGVPFACFTPNCMSANRDIVSKTNLRFKQRLQDIGVASNIEFVLGKRSFDLNLEDSKVLIEINPSYTHNSFRNHWGQGLDRYYHRDKTDLAEKNGYRCIHVWDWDDWGKVIDLIRPIERRIYARNCDIYRINKDVGDKFLNLYHLQGTCRGQLLYLGLVYEGELVELMTFGKSRYDKHYYVELMRLCTKPGVKVVGGASRLFSYATSEYGLSSIISYCDRSKFRGDVYEKIGMKFKRITPPQEVWSKSTQHITANLLRARGYDQLFGTNYGKGTSNEELMLQNGWLPVYDCGQSVYTFE